MWLWWICRIGVLWNKNPGPWRALPPPTLQGRTSLTGPKATANRQLAGGRFGPGQGEVAADQRRRGRGKTWGVEIAFHGVGQVAGPVPSGYADGQISIPIRSRSGRLSALPEKPYRHAWRVAGGRSNSVIEQGGRGWRAPSWQWTGTRGEG